jgi:PAS domain-containing protein
MFDRLGLPRPQIATKLYGAIALTLAVLYLLGAGTIYFASQTEDAVALIRQDALQAVRLLHDLEASLERQRSLVASVPLDFSADASARDEQAFAAAHAEAAAILARLGPSQEHRLARDLAQLAALGTAVFELGRMRQPEQASASVAKHADASRDLQRALAAERHRRTLAADAALDTMAARSRTLIAWVCAAAAITGLLIGPVGLLLLRRVLSRLQGIGWALLRLARNDTSIDIPGLNHQDEVGQLARSVAVFKARSIELLQKKSEFERLNLQLDAAINNMPLGLSMFDGWGRLLVCNHQYARMHGLPSELTQPGTPHCALWEHRVKGGAQHHPSTGAAFVPDAGEPASMTIEYGNERIISVTTQPLKGGGWVALDEDITQRRRQEREITHLARHDALTNLANRALLREQLQQALQRLGRGQGFAVLCLDLDRFKSVNDTLGHPVGDALLKQVSVRLLDCVRQGDLVARLGGDEFAITSPPRSA